MFNALLIAVALSSSTPSVQAKPAKAEKVWTCSAAQDLIQGSGTVKRCEWK